MPAKGEKDDERNSNEMEKPSLVRAWYETSQDGVECNGVWSGKSLFLGRGEFACLARHAPTNKILFEMLAAIEECCKVLYFILFSIMKIQRVC